MVLKIIVKYIDENIFDGIHLILPQLKMLWFGTNRCHKMTDNSLKSIAKLKDLTHLRLNRLNDLDITAKGLKYLIDSCERLKYVNHISLSYS